MRLDLVIEHWNELHPGSEIPSDIPTTNYFDFEEICLERGIKHYPTFMECNAIWNEMFDKNQLLQAGKMI